MVPARGSVSAPLLTRDTLPLIAMFKVVLGIAALVLVVGLLARTAIRALRHFVRSVWPHS